MILEAFHTNKSPLAELMAKKRDAYRYFLVIVNVMLSYSALRQSVASVDIYSSDKLLNIQ